MRQETEAWLGGIEFCLYDATSFILDVKNALAAFANMKLIAWL